MAFSQVWDGKMPNSEMMKSRQRYGWMAGDSLSINGTLPGGIASSIDTSVAGQITLHLTNSASLADYQTALGDVRYVNSNLAPDRTDRDITVVASDSESNSNIAHAQSMLPTGISSARSHMIRSAPAARSSRSSMGCLAGRPRHLSWRTGPPRWITTKRARLPELANRSIRSFMIS
jgi:hypothetical protein